MVLATGSWANATLGTSVVPAAALIVVMKFLRENFGIEITELLPFTLPCSKLRVDIVYTTPMPFAITRPPLRCTAALRYIAAIIVGTMNRVLPVHILLFTVLAPVMACAPLCAGEQNTDPAASAHKAVAP